MGGAYYEGGEYYDPITEEFIVKAPEGHDCFDNTGFIDTLSRTGKDSGGLCPPGGWSFYSSDNRKLTNGVASFGVGITMRLGFLEMNWVFAKRTNFSETLGPWRSAFYIGNKF